MWTGRRLFGVKALRDVAGTTQSAAEQTSWNQVYQRARHVITENARTLEAADELESGNLEKWVSWWRNRITRCAMICYHRCLPLMRWSKSCKTYRYRWRCSSMTGGGLVVVWWRYCARLEVAEVIAAVEAEYPLKRIGLKPTYVCKSQCGCRPILIGAVHDTTHWVRKWRRIAAEADDNRQLCCH